MGRKYMNYRNYQGYIYYETEEELCKELENNYFTTYFDVDWQPIEAITKEVWISSNSRIDYYGKKMGLPTYVEVKNWFISDKDIMQILRYNMILGRLDHDFGFTVICGGIDSDKRQVLMDHMPGIEIIETRDIAELQHLDVGSPLAYWM